MKIVVGLVLGAAIAAVVACGGAKMTAGSKASAPPPGAMDGAGTPAPDDPRAQIEKLEAQINGELDTMGLPKPTPTMQPMNVSVTPARPAADPSCKPAPTDTCKDSCKLADSICDNAKKICDLAAGMNDDWANGKCNSGNTSCETARRRCCGCN